MSDIPLNKENAVSELRRLFARFEHACERAQYRRSFIAGGCGFEFLSNQEFYLPLIDRALRPLRAEAGAETASPAKILSTSFGELGLPRLRWVDPDLDVLAMDALLKDTAYRLHVDQANQVYSCFDLGSDRGIQLSRAMGRQPPWESGGPLRIFIHWYLVKRARTLVHAGSLAVDGVGILLAGPGGSGKSSTVMSGIAEGLGSVGDDYISVETNGQIILRPVFEIMKLAPSRLSAIGIKPVSAVNWQNKVELARSELPWPSRGGVIEARALCLPKVAHEPGTRFLRIPPTEAFLALTLSTLMQLPGDRDHLFRTGAAIARKLPCYAIALGTEPKEIAESIASFITSELK